MYMILIHERMSSSFRQDLSLLQNIPVPWKIHLSESKKMEYFSKLKNTVTGALPGNPVTREFDILGHQASAGPGLMWKVYDAMKKTTKQVILELNFQTWLLTGWQCAASQSEARF